MTKTRSEYRFGLADHQHLVRESHASAAGQVEQGVGVALWAPLDGFQWKGRRYKLADNTWIRPRREYSGYRNRDFRPFLSTEERERCASIRHWLQITKRVHSPLSSRAMVNAALTSLWIACPTRTHVPLRFEEAESGVRSAIRVLDRFQWVEGHVAEELTENDLAETARILPRVQESLLTQKRLARALELTFRGCVTNVWGSATVLYVAAIETLLSDGDECSMDRLSRHYAALVADNPNTAQIAAKRFRSLLAIRSDIIHGRLSRADEGDALETFSAFAELLRQLWKTILSSKKLTAALELSGAERAPLFSQLCKDCSLGVSETVK